MSGCFPWAIPLFVGAYVVIAVALSVGLNLRLRRRYPEVFEAVGRPRLLSRDHGFLWDLAAHRKVLSRWDWRLRMIAVWFDGLGMAAAVAVGIWSGWQLFR